MVYDLSVELIQATVQLEQPLADGSRTVGTGFLIADTDADGRPRTILITAAHVLDRMPDVSARIGYRVQARDGVWRYDPQALRIRDGDHPLWVQHAGRDVAALVVQVPPAFARAAIPLAWLAEDDTFDKFALGPGDEMMVLGFPRGLSANTAGFPILRSGRVASYPLAPVTAYPTFLMDFSVFPGNSGGPVFMAEGARRRPGAKDVEDVQFIAGIVTQQVELSGERLEIGIVTHARYIRETIALLGKAPPKALTEGPSVGGPKVQAAAAASAAVSAIALGEAR